MDRNDCEQRFGAANIARVETFIISAGKADFGDELHIAGEPRGNAVICWLNNGRIAVLGRVYSDNLREAQTATVEIRFRRSDGKLSNPSTRSASNNPGWVGKKEVAILSPPGDYREVRIRLKQRYSDPGIADPPVSILATRTFRRRFSETVRLHFKILTPPILGTNVMLTNMQQLYGAAQIDVQLVSVEQLNLRDLNDIDVGFCIEGLPTDEQKDLFEHRNSVNAHEVVVYFVRSTVPPYSGCAVHPAGKPGAVVASLCTQFTLAHEVGHVLGLIHVNDDNRLMTGNGTANIKNLPPDLVRSEVEAMYASELT